eukprot:gnl/MRDRNA2_/MRDRNA2_72903_c0_seq1.p1 gnl/MRDRNA2_/MRDRNA2_72903_c0~~gnl/MRDRNA2_/MRDRNA2_72903_c0_seq1.p1  ORF type:complete len:2370 (-),score=481.66 gnl/MRDRNA2_/MRDRNA2_72903_c0_seq1:129-6743(-)
MLRENTLDLESTIDANLAQSVSETNALKLKLKSKQAETQKLDEEHQKLLAEIRKVEQQNKKLNQQASKTTPKTLETAFQRHRLGRDAARREWCQVQNMSRVREKVLEMRHKKLNKVTERAKTLKQDTSHIEAKIHSLRSASRSTKFKLESISDETEAQDEEIWIKRERLRTEIEQRKAKYADVLASTKHLERILQGVKPKTLLETCKKQGAELQVECDSLTQKVSSERNALADLRDKCDELELGRLPAIEQRITVLSAEKPTRQVLDGIRAVLQDQSHLDGDGSSQPRAVLALIKKLRLWLEDSSHAGCIRVPSLLDVVVKAAKEHKNDKKINAETQKLLRLADVNQEAVTQLVNAIKLGTPEAMREAYKVGEAQHVMWTHPDVMSKAEEFLDKIDGRGTTEEVLAELLQDLAEANHELSDVEQRISKVLSMPSNPDEALLAAAARAVVEPRLWRVASQVESWAKQKPADRQDWVVSHGHDSMNLDAQLHYAFKLAKRFNADDRLLLAADKLKQQHSAEAEALRDLEISLEDGSADTIEGSLQRAEKAGLAEDCKKVREALAQQDVALFVETDNNDLAGLQEAIEFAASEGVPSARLEVARQRAKDMMTLRSEYGIGTRDVLYPSGHAPDDPHHRNALRGSNRGTYIAHMATSNRRTNGTKRFNDSIYEQSPTSRIAAPLPPAQPDVQVAMLAHACVVTTFLETETRGGNIDEMLQGLIQAEEALPRIQMLPALNQRLSKAKRRAGDRVLKELDESIHQLQGYGLERWVEKVHALGLRDESMIEVEKNACEVAAQLEKAVAERNLLKLSRGLLRLDGNLVRVKYKKGRSDAEADIHGFTGGFGSPLMVSSVAENGLAEGVGVRPGHLVVGIVHGEVLENLSHKTADQATSSLRGAKEVHFRVGGVLLPESSSQTVRERVHNVRTQATNLVKHMLSMALGTCDIQQLEACMGDLRPQGLLSATFDAEVAMCNVVRELEKALETKDFSNLCAHLLKVKGCCIPVKYTSEHRISSESLRNRGQYAADAVIVIEHLHQGGPASRAGLVSGSALMGTKGPEGEWVDPPRGSLSEVVAKLDELAEQSSDGITVFFLKPGLPAPPSAPALLHDRLKSTSDEAVSLVVQMVDQAILDLDENTLRSRIESMEKLRIRSGWQIWREFEIFSAADRLSAAVAGKDEEILLQSIDMLSGLEWEFARSGPPLLGASEALLSRLHAVKDEALDALRPFLTRGVREVRPDLLAKYPPRMQRLRVADESMELRCAQARLVVEVRQDFLSLLKTEVVNVQRRMFASAQGHAQQEEDDEVWLSQNNYEEAVGLTDLCERLLDNALATDDPMKAAGPTGKLKQLVRKAFRLLPEMPEDVWAPAEAALLQNAVEERGGCIGGEIWIMIGWSNELHASPTDYGLHVTCPCGTELSSTQPRCPTCLLSFDSRASFHGKRGDHQGVESILLPGGALPGDGIYSVKVVARSGPRVPLVVVARVGTWQRVLRVRAEPYAASTSLIAFECKDGRPLWEIHRGYLQVSGASNAVDQLRQTDLAEVKDICRREEGLVGFTVPASHGNLGADPGLINAGWFHSAWTLVSPKPDALLLDQPVALSIPGYSPQEAGISSRNSSASLSSNGKSRWAPLDGQKGTWFLGPRCTGTFWSIDLGEERYVDSLMIEWLPGSYPYSFSVVEVGGSEGNVLATVTGAGPVKKVRLGTAVQVLEIRVLECDPEDESGPAVCEVHYGKDVPPPSAEIQGLTSKGDQILVESVAVEDQPSALPPPALLIHTRTRGTVDISGTYLRRSEQWDGRVAYEKRKEEISEVLTERSSSFCGLFVEEKKGKKVIRAMPQSFGMAADPQAHIEKLEEMMWDWMEKNEKNSCVAHLGLMVNPQMLEEGIMGNYQMGDSESYAKLGKADIGNAFDTDWSFSENWHSTPIHVVGAIGWNAIAVYRLEIHVTKPTYALRWQAPYRNDAPDVLGYWVIDPKGFRDDHSGECAAELKVFAHDDVPHPAITDHPEVWRRRPGPMSGTGHELRPDPTFSVLGVSTGSKCEVMDNTSGIWYPAVVYGVDAAGIVDVTVTLSGTRSSFEEVWKGYEVKDLRPRQSALRQFGLGAGDELIGIGDMVDGKLRQQPARNLMSKLQEPGPHVLKFAWRSPGFALQTVQLFEGDDEEKPSGPTPRLPKATDQGGLQWVSYRKLNYPIPNVGGRMKRRDTFKQFNTNL